jgi:rhamnose utilization protein RhaD (predicted bifunctional aldolase and dehydrogenase)
VRRLFDGKTEAPPLWIPVINPGYALSAVVKKEMEDYIKAHGRPPEMLFLQNHGIFVGANAVSGIKDIYRRVMDRIAAETGRAPDFSGAAGEFGHSAKIKAWLQAALSSYYPSAHDKEGPFVRFDRNNAIATLVRDRASFAPVSSAFTPDHIVYAGSAPLFIGPQGLPSDAARGERAAVSPSGGVNALGPQGLPLDAARDERAAVSPSGGVNALCPQNGGPLRLLNTPRPIASTAGGPQGPPSDAAPLRGEQEERAGAEIDEEAVAGAVERHVAKTGRPPKVIAAQGVGVYCVGPHQKAADLAYALFLDAVKVAAYSETFGGPSFMPQDKIDFINNWEVERYRSRVSVKE